MLLIVKKARFYAPMAILTVVLALSAVFLLTPQVSPVMGSGAVRQRIIYVLDAGHGGADGGAVSPDGVAEDDINLAVVRDLQLFFHLLGRETALTRTDTGSLADPDSTTLRQQKVTDTHNRVAYINSIDGGCLVSIHQNILPGHPGVHGAQVFYGAVSGSDALAASVQASLNGAVNPGNEKAAKPIGGDIYIMKHAACPAILVECGFLSNAKETQLLQTEPYQLTLAAVIACGCLQNSG